jgi:hypothetical protein
MKRVLLAALGALLLWPSAAAAHDVPDDVKLKIFLKPEAGRMLILVRIPANALIDIVFPTRPESGWLNLSQIDGYAREGAKVWVADLLSIYEGGDPLPEPNVIGVRIARTNSSSFDTFQSALAHVSGDRMPSDTLLGLDQAAVDALLETPIRSPHSDFSFEPRFARVGVRVTTTLEFLPADGGIRQFVYEGDAKTFHLDPSRIQAFTRLMQAGFAHYFDQADYLLFLLCIAILFDRFRPLALFATAFAAAQFLALIGFAFGLAPSEQWISLWGVLISAATVYAGIEAIVGGADGSERWGFAIVAGLLFGSGFCFALRPMIQFGGAHRLASVFAFDAAILVSYASALLLLFGAARALRRISSAPRAALIIAAAVALHVSWHRMLARAHALSLSPMSSPVTNLATILMAVAAAAALAVWVYRSRRISPAAP